MKQLVDIRTLLDKAKPNSPYWALVDAFDAAANGMENPDALARMEQISDADLQPWKQLVYAIRALYGEDPSACAAAVSAMGADNPPARLKPLFKAWMGIARSPDPKGLLPALADGPAEIAALYGELFRASHPIVQRAEQAEEALLHGMLEQYEALVHRILRELQEMRGMDGPAAAVRFALHCLERTEIHGCPDGFLYPVLLRALGRSDGFCAIGLSLAERNGEAAAEALRGALEAEDGVFLDRQMRPALEALAERLEASKRKTNGWADGKTDAMETRQETRRIRRKRTARAQTLQLDLFGQVQDYHYGI